MTINNFHFQLRWQAQPLRTAMETIEVVARVEEGEVVPEELDAGVAGEAFIFDYCNDVLDPEEQ